MEVPSYDQMSNQSYDDIVRLAQQMHGGEPAPAAEAAPAHEPEQVAEAAAAEPEETPAEEAGETPAQEAAEEAAHVEQESAPAPEERRGNPAEALRQERERARQLEERARQEAHQRQLLEQQHQQLLAALNDPDRLEAHLRTIKPQPAPDFEDDPQGAVAHVIQPLLAEIQQLKARDQQREALLQHQQYMANMVATHGQDFPSVVAQFDQQFPHLAGLNPEVKYFTAKGQQAVQAGKLQPVVEQQRVEQLADQKAVEKLAGALASGAPVKGIATLGSAPQAKPQANEPDVTAMSYEDMSKLNPQQLQAALRRAHGG